MVKEALAAPESLGWPQGIAPAENPLDRAMLVGLLGSKGLPRED